MQRLISTSASTAMLFTLSKACDQQCLKNCITEEMTQKSAQCAVMCCPEESAMVNSCNLMCQSKNWQCQFENSTDCTLTMYECNSKCLLQGGPLSLAGTVGQQQASYECLNKSLQGQDTLAWARNIKANKCFPENEVLNQFFNQLADACIEYSKCDMVTEEGLKAARICSAHIAKGLAPVNQDQFFTSCFADEMNRGFGLGVSLARDNDTSLIEQLGSCLAECDTEQCLLKCADLFKEQAQKKYQETVENRLAMWQPNKDYYNMNNVNARHTKCLDTCKFGDVDCAYYCNQMVSEQTSTSIDIQMGGKVPEVKQNWCSEWRDCKEWDYYCNKECDVAADWSVVQKMTLWSPYDHGMSGKEYYSRENISARYAYCKDQCQKLDAFTRSDCSFYCTSRKIEQTSIGIDVRAGWKPNAIQFPDNCYRSCYEWDYACLDRCEPESWRYSSLLQVGDSFKEQMALWSPYDHGMSGKEYYSNENISARYAYCKDQCQKLDAFTRSDCSFYCTSRKIEQTSIGIDVRAGWKPDAIQFPDNCYRSCYEWDYACLDRCEPNSWRYSSLIQQVSEEETQAMTLYSPYDHGLSGKEYYSNENINGRYAYCQKQCQKLDAFTRSDCSFYCTSRKIDQTSTGIDVRAGWKPNAIQFPDNCYRYCYEWDYQCLDRCEPDSWEYSSLLQVKSGNLNALTLWQPRDENVSGKEYYKSENISARFAYCNKQCEKLDAFKRADCKYYCNAHQTDQRMDKVDVDAGWKPNAIQFPDNCYRYSCYAWDYACLDKCEPDSWEYSSLLQIQAMQSLASSSFNPTATGAGYYSQENNQGRYNKCVSLCDNDFDCKWYCGQMRFHDNDVRLSNWGKEPAWQPATNCETWKKNGYWYYGTGIYSGGCYEWDYKCLLACNGPSWKYAPSLLIDTKAVTLAKAKFDPTAIDNKDYYSDANNKAREAHCKAQCPKGDHDCTWYCGQMAWKDNDITFDINFGTKQAEHGWYPQNKCEKMKKEGLWWMGHGKYRGGCYSWDYECLYECMGSTWQYGLLALPQVATEATCLAFRPYDTANTDYYSSENNAARKQTCLNHCNNDFDCKWYCGQMAWKNNDIRLDIKMGNKKKSQGWYPQNKCQTWKRYNQWWEGWSNFRGGCYEWDYNCQKSCMGSSWEYALMLASSASEDSIQAYVDSYDFNNQVNYSIYEEFFDNFRIQKRQAKCTAQCKGQYFVNQCNAYCTKTFNEEQAIGERAEQLLDQGVVWQPHEKCHKERAKEMYANPWPDESSYVKGCWDWDYNCMVKCEGASFDFAPAPANYYNNTLIEERLKKCNAQCSGLFEETCQQYCTSAQMADQLTAQQISGGLQSSSRWQPANSCEKPKAAYMYGETTKDGGCFSWDYNCLSNCMPWTWPYQPPTKTMDNSGVSQNIGADGLVDGTGNLGIPSGFGPPAGMDGFSLATKQQGFLTLASFNPNAVSNSDYYSVSNNIARSNYCQAQCNNHPDTQSDCMYYCSNLSYTDSSTHTDIAMGNKKASQGWYPQNKCETWKRYGQWWNGNGVYAEGCYAWDYHCLSTCMGSSWEYAPMVLAQKKASAEGFVTCVTECVENDFECATVCKNNFFVYDSAEVAEFLAELDNTQEIKVVQAFTGVANVQVAAFDQCLNECFPKHWPEVSNCYSPCEAHLQSGETPTYDEFVQMGHMRTALIIYEGCVLACSSDSCLNTCKSEFMDNQISLAALDKSITSVTAQAHDECLAKCESNLSSACTSGCIDQLTSQISLFTTGEFDAAVDSNKNALKKFFQCAQKAETQEAWDSCRKNLDSQWKRIECDNVVDFDELDAYLENFYNQVKDKLSQVKGASEQRVDEIAQQQTLLLQQAMALDNHRRAWRKNVNSLYSEKKPEVSFVEFGEKQLNLHRAQKNELAACNAADKCAWTCLFHEEFEEQEVCLASNCNCQISVFEEDFTCTSDCIAQCSNSAQSWEELEICKEQTCQCQKDLSKLGMAIDEFFAPQQTTRLFGLNKEVKRVSVYHKLSLLTLLIVSGVVCIIYTVKKVESVTKNQKVEKKEKKQEAKSTLVEDKNASFTFSEPYEKVM